MVVECKNSNFNYTGSMKDTAKGAAHMEKRARELLPGITIFPRMGGFYYTTPSAVKNPGIVHEYI